MGMRIKIRMNMSMTRMAMTMTTTLIMKTTTTMTTKICQKKYILIGDFNITLISIFLYEWCY